SLDRALQSQVAEIPIDLVVSPTVRGHTDVGKEELLVAKQAGGHPHEVPFRADEDGLAARAELAADLTEVALIQLLVLIIRSAPVCIVPECEHLLRVLGEVGEHLALHTRSPQFMACLQGPSPPFALEASEILVKGAPDDRNDCRGEPEERFKPAPAQRQ